MIDVDLIVSFTGTFLMLCCILLIVEEAAKS